MSKLTRRGMLGLAGGGALGLAACTEQATKPRVARDTDTRPAYPSNVSFQHGIASGDPLHDRVILWTRVTPETDEGVNIPVAWGLFADEEMTEPLRYELAEAKRANDWCVKVDVEGLEPATEYYFRFIARGAGGDISSGVGRTKTTAATGSNPVKLAAVSCSNWQFGLFNAYKALAAEPDLDAIVHLGDYIYEYGPEGYGGEARETLGRIHAPAREILTLDDYRGRHAQYKTDPDLQAAHASAPWICTWDDHESANDSHSAGAENHDPADGEGTWSERKRIAVQAYMEWMPVRNPGRDGLTGAIWRTFNFGDVASVHALETRLVGRSVGIDWLDEIGGVERAQVPMKAAQTMLRVQDEARSMLGAQQEEWLAGELEASANAGRSWQVLGNQTIMARTRAPFFQRTLTDEQKAAQEMPQIQALIQFSALGLPWNLDAWDGFPAARERLYDAAEAAGARLVTLTGDTHTAWANTLTDSSDNLRGVEFACTSITSPGIPTYIKDVDDLGEQFVDANDEIEWMGPVGHGYTLVTLTPERAVGEYKMVSTILAREFDVQTVSKFETRRDGDSMTGLSKV